MSTNSALPELLPCPHCGSTNVLCQELGGDGRVSENYWGASCFDCGMYGDTEAEAIALWNRRSAPPDSQVSPDVPVSGWISVDERLPTNPRRVLVTYRCAARYGHAGRERVFMARFSGGLWRFVEGPDALMSERVTHWMPRPDAASPKDQEGTR